MKTAILVAVSEDGKSGSPITGVVPYDVAARTLKTAVSAPDGYAAIEIYVKSGKRRKFKQAVPAPETQPVTVPGLNASEPGEETPQAAEDSTSENNQDTIEVSSASPEGAGKKHVGKSR